MPGPFAVSTALHAFNSFGRGPYQYGSKLFCFAFSDYQNIQAFVSEDDGVTWTATGGAKTISSSVNALGGCKSLDGQSVYVLYVSGSFVVQRLKVSRFDMNSGTFVDDSSDGPILNSGAGNSPVLCIEQSTDTTLVILTKTFRSGSQSTASITTLDEALGSWDTLHDPAGQTGSLLFLGVGLVRGASDRVHGFVVETDGSDQRLLHVLAYGSGGGIGSAFSEIVPEIMQGFPNVSAAAAGASIAVAYNSPDVGIGSPQAISVAIATDADNPSWTTTVADAATVGTEDGSQVALIGGDSLRLVYRPVGGDVLFSIYNGASWNLPESLFSPNLNAVYIEGKQITDGLGVLFADTDFSTDAVSSYFQVPGGAQINGSAGIPSEEAFGKTHGVFGGGSPETCGAPVHIPPAVPCQQIPVTPAYPGDQDGCPTRGYSL